MDARRILNFNKDTCQGVKLEELTNATILSRMGWRLSTSAGIENQTLCCMEWLVTVVHGPTGNLMRPNGGGVSQ